MLLGNFPVRVNEANVTFTYTECESSSEIKYEKLLKFGNRRLSTANVTNMLNPGFSSENTNSFELYRLKHKN